MQELRQTVTGLGDETIEFLKALDAAHQTMSHDLRKDLDGHVAGLRHAVAGLRHEAAIFVRDLDDAHQTLAREQHRQLQAEQAQLASAVATLRHQLQAELGKVRSDHGQARRVWSSCARLMRQRRTRQAAPSPMPETPAMPPVETPVSPSVTQPATPPSGEGPHDDLTSIRGIGPAMSRRLNQAGIHTYAQLAASNPDELRKGLGEVGRLASVQEWIAQAAALTRQM